MPTLKQMQDAGQNADLANYYYVYNEEYNALVTMEQRTEAAIFDVEHDPSGVDAAQRLALRSMLAGIEARMHKLDEKMLAFQASTLSITPPTQDQIQRIKTLSGQVSQAQAKSDAAASIVGFLTQMAQITTQMHGA